MLSKGLIFCAAMWLLLPMAYAEDSIMIEGPELPDTLEDGEAIGLEILIVEEEDRTVEEYRVGGALYMIKVTPIAGPVYYLVDTDGDGALETTRHELDSGMLIPSWVLLKW